MHEGRRAKGAVVVLMFLGTTLGVFVSPLPFSPVSNVSADSMTLYADGFMDGWLDKSGASYPPWTTTIPDNTSSDFYLGQDKAGDYYIDRAFISFNTSTIPNDAIVLNAMLRLRLSWDGSTTNFDVRVHSTYYPGWAGIYPKWNATGGFVGNLFNTAGLVLGNWYSMSVGSSLVNLTGNTQFLLNSSRDPTTTPTGKEWVGFYSGNSSSKPELIVSYKLAGTSVSLELDPGGWTTWLNSTAFPEVSEWNLTHDLYYFAIDTVPNSKNLTIWKLDANWSFKGVTPGCNYTENSTALLLSDVFDSICYRVWFTVPKASPYSTVHITLYNAFTGEGFFWENWKVQICPGAIWNNLTASTVPTPDYKLQPDSIYTLRVLDYFNNGIVEQTFVTSANDVFVTVPVPVYSYKFYNQNPSFALLRIYYNLTGVPYSEFIPPYDHVDRYLKAGTYRFMITFYDANGVVGNTYTWVRTIPSATFPGAGFVILEGDTITEAIVAASGTKALAQVIAELVGPEMVWVGYSVPQIPAYLLTISSFVVNQNLFMVNGALLDTHTGTNETFPTPYPGATLYATTTRDLFTFAGNNSAHVIVNRTADNANLLNSATLPAPSSLAAWNATTMSVWSNQTIGTTRDSIWRFYRAFTYQFLVSQSEYRAEVTLRNEAVVNWTNVTLFIPFANASYVNNRSVALYDMNNTVYLSEGTHWVQSDTGVYMWFNRWNFSATRGFRLSYNSVNESQYKLPASVIVNTLGDGITQLTAWSGKAYYFAIARWTNAYREDYKGVFYITLELPISYDESSVVILRSNGAVVTDAIVGARSIVIPTIEVAVGDTIEFTILFDNKRPSSVTDIRFGDVPVLYIAVFIALVGFMVGIFLTTFREETRFHLAGKMALGFGTIALILIFLMYIYYIAIS